MKKDSLYLHVLPFTLRWLATGAILAVSALFSLAVDTDPVPLDPTVRVGRLPNGLTYYLRQNAKPENRLELRLVVNAGSVLEDDDQRGMAHFVEHLAFRGTARYPGVELIHYLQSLGAGFGPDVNARTSFDETVYQLTIPADSEEGVRKGVGILADWAHGVTLSDDAIATERNVVLEEWRLGRGAQQRMSDQLIPALFKGSNYAERLPIGTKESIESASPDSIRRFYRDWYRPDNMAVVAMGDADPGRIEQIIKAEFAGIPAPQIPRALPAPAVPQNKEPQALVASDKENPHNVALLVWKSEPQPARTAADHRRDLVRELFSVMLNLRLAERQQQAGAPFLHAQGRFGRWLVRSAAGYQLMIVTADGGIERGVEAAEVEALRVRRFGFLASELDRAKAALLRQLEQQYHERDKTPSTVFADLLIRHHLQDEPAPGVEFLLPFARQSMPGISLAEVNASAARLLPDDNRVVVVQSVEKPQVELPAAARILAALRQAGKARIEAYAEKKLEGGLLSSRPAPGRAVAAKPLEEIQALEVHFANGVRLVLKPTPFQNDQVLLSAFRPGGQSGYPDDYALSAQLATAYLGEAGLGNFSKSDLQKMLADKRVGFLSVIGTYFDGIKGQSSTDDLETLLQLIHLRFVAPRDDAAAYQVVVAQQQGLLKSLRANPEMAFADEVQRWIYQDHPRTPGVIPTEAEWAALSHEKVRQVARERFASAAGFTFEIVGAFDAKTVLGLATTYLGGLPAQPKAENFRDLGIRAIEGSGPKIIRHGKEPKGIVVLALERAFPYDVSENHRFWSLGNILGRALVDRLRLTGAKVYEAKVQAEVTKAPYPHASMRIVIPCAPDNADKVAQLAMDEIRRLRRDGPTQKELEKEIESQRRTVEKEMKENDRWLGKLEMIYRDQEPFTRLAAPEKLIALVTGRELQALAQQHLDPDKFNRATLLPQSEAAGGGK